MGRWQLTDQPAVKGVAIPRDPGQQIAQPQRRLGGAGPVTAEARGHQHHSGQHRRGFQLQLRPSPGLRCLRRDARPGEHAVERRLLDDHSPVAALFIDPGGIPEAKQVIRSTGCRMKEVEGPRIDREFFECREIEVGLKKEFGRRGRQNVDRPGHEPRIAAVGDARSGHEQGNRSNSFVRIGRREPAVLEHGHGPPSNIVIKPVNRGGDQSVSTLVGSPQVTGGLRQERPRRRHHEERPFDPARGLVLQQVGVELPIGGQQPIEQQPQHQPGLAGVAKGGLRRLEFPQPRSEPFGHPGCRLRPLDDRSSGRRLLGGVEFAEGPPGRRIEGAGGEVEIADDDRCGIGLLRWRRGSGHAGRGFEDEICHGRA